jgi:Tfp pilus assembly protein PilF
MTKEGTVLRRTCSAVVALALAALMSAVLTGCGDAKPAGKPATADQLVQIGLRALEAKDQAKALTAFEQAAAKAPENYYAHYNIGFIKQQQGKPAEALEQYQLALATKPDFVPALYNSGTIYGASDPAHAMTVYRQVVKIDPKYASAYFNLGLLESANGQVDQGVKDLARAIALDPSYLARVPATVRPKLPASPTPKPKP